MKLGDGTASGRSKRNRPVHATPALTTLLAACALAMGAAGPGSGHAVAAPAAGVYGVTQWTLDGGGGKSSGGTFVIQGTIGQPDADPLQPSSGGSYGITGGYWPGLIPGETPDEVFDDGFE